MPPKKQSKEERPESPVKSRKIVASASKSPGRGRPRKRLESPTKAKTASAKAAKVPATPKSGRKRSTSRSRVRKVQTEPAPTRARSRSSSGIKKKLPTHLPLTNKTIIVETTPISSRTTRSYLKTSPMVKVETRASRSRVAALTANSAAGSSTAPGLSTDEEKALRRRIVAGTSQSPSVQQRTQEVAQTVRAAGCNVWNSVKNVYKHTAFWVVLAIFIFFYVVYYINKNHPNFTHESTVYVTNNYYYIRDQAAARLNDLSASIQGEKAAEKTVPSAEVRVEASRADD